MVELVDELVTRLRFGLGAPAWPAAVARHPNEILGGVPVGLADDEVALVELWTLSSGDVDQKVKVRWECRAKRFFFVVDESVSDVKRLVGMPDPDPDGLCRV